jgi:hypothetical protein
MDIYIYNIYIFIYYSYIYICTSFNKTNFTDDIHICQPFTDSMFLVAQEMPGKTWADGHWLGSCLHLAAAREHQPSRWPTALEGGIPEAQGRLGPR